MSKKGRLIRNISIGVVIAALMGTGGYFFLLKPGSNNTVTQQQRTIKVTKGEISTSVTGSGPLTASDVEKLNARVDGTITKINFKEGDVVKAGDVLLEMDPTEQQLALEKAKNAIESADVSNRSILRSISDLNITAPFSGVVSSLSVKQGDTVDKGAMVLTLTDTANFKAVIPFVNQVRSELVSGQAVTVTAFDSARNEGYTLHGTISYVSNASSTNAEGNESYNVEIRVANPGNLKEGLVANAEIQTSKGTVTGVNTATLAYADTLQIKSTTGGDVTVLNVHQGQYVKEGDLMVGFSSDDLANSEDTANIKMKELNTQYQTELTRLSYYKVTAGISGTITSMDLKVGNTVKAGGELATISDISTLEFELPIDELDINKMQAGQDAEVSVDALTETATKPLAGKVTRVAVEGSASSGVTTYPVIVTVANNGKLKPGMNANATVIISKKSDILVVPLEAVQKRNGQTFVMVLSNGSNGGMTGNGSAAGNGGRRQGARNQTSGTGMPQAPDGQQSEGGQPSPGEKAGASGTSLDVAAGRATRTNASYYANTRPVKVEIGINNEQYVEITSGLSEGDVVVLPPLTASTSGTGTAATQQGNMGMMGGMMGGGPMDGGGPPANFGGNGNSGNSNSNRKSGNSNSGNRQ